MACTKMEIEKVMDLAEFNEAYTAYQTLLMREGTICPTLVSLRLYLYRNVVGYTKTLRAGHQRR